MAKVKNSENQYSDIELTKKDGKRVLIEAFSIAAVIELDEGASVTLKVPVATGSEYVVMRGMAIEVQESYDTIAQMRRGL